MQFGTKSRNNGVYLDGYKFNTSENSEITDSGDDAWR